MDAEEIEVSLDSGKTIKLTFEEFTQLRNTEMQESVKKAYSRQLDNRTRNFFDFAAEGLEFPFGPLRHNQIQVTLPHQLGEHPYGVPFLKFKEPNLHGMTFFSRKNTEETSNYWELSLSGQVHRVIDKARYDDIPGITRLVQRLKETPAEVLAVESALMGNTPSPYSETASLSTSIINNFIEKATLLPDLDFAKLEVLMEKDYNIYNINIVDPKTLRLVRIPGLAMISHPYNSLRYVDKDIRTVGYLPLIKKENFGMRGERMLTTKRWGKFIGKLPKSITGSLTISPYLDMNPSGKNTTNVQSPVHAYAGAFGLLNSTPITLSERELLLPILENQELSPYEKSLKAEEIFSLKNT